MCHTSLTLGCDSGSQVSGSAYEDAGILQSRRGYQAVEIGAAVYSFKTFIGPLLLLFLFLFCLAMTRCVDTGLARCV